MSRTRTSILLFSDDKEISASVQKALARTAGLKMNAQDVSVAQVNGHALDLAADSDIVIIATDPENAEDLTAIRNLDARREGRTVFLALADRNISLASARALSDAGVDEVLPYPMAEEELKRQVDKWIKKVSAASRSAGDREGAVIPVIQARGGVGSTTVAVNLADQLAGRKSRFRKEAVHSVVIVDLDLQFGTVGDFLDVDPQDAMMQMARGGIIPDAMWVEQSLAETPGGLHVLTAPQDFAPLDSISEMQVKALVDVLRQTHDYVVIDLPRALVSWIDPIMAVADQAIIVTDTSVPSIRASRRLMDFYRGENPTLDFNVVISHEKKPMMLAQHHKEAAKLLDVKFDHWLPHDAKAARSAIDYGKPLSEVAPRSDLGKAIANLAKSTLKAMPVVERASQ